MKSIKNRRRPVPPEGYVRFKPECVKLGPMICPVCGSDRGMTWFASEWQDEDFERAYRGLSFAERNQLVVRIGGVDVREHWSRFNRGECGKCRSMLWHDFGGDRTGLNLTADDEGPEWFYYREAMDGDQLRLL